MLLPPANNITTPKVTVLMAVYNGAAHVGPVIESVLQQDYQDFDFLIIDDGSTDDTPRILADYAHKDGRIILLQQQNQGLTKSLNRGLAAARGQYIARQDADDRALPGRLSALVKALDDHPETALVGSNARDIYTGDGRQHFWGWHNHEALQDIVWRATPFPHSSVMMRRDTALELGGYDESFQTSQDSEFWMRFARRGPIMMLPDPLIERHIHPNSISSTKQRQQWRDGFRARMMHAPGGLRTALQVLGRQILLACLPERFLLALKKKRQNQAFSDNA